MAFIREDERLKQTKERALEQATGPGTALKPSAGGGGMGTAAPSAIPQRFEKSTGQRGPLLADYLRANIKSKTGQGALSQMERQASDLTKTAWKGDEKGPQYAGIQEPMTGVVGTNKPTGQSFPVTASAPVPPRPKLNELDMEGSAAAQAEWDRQYGPNKSKQLTQQDFQAAVLQSVKQAKPKQEFALTQPANSPVAAESQLGANMRQQPIAAGQSPYGSTLADYFNEMKTAFTPVETDATKAKEVAQDIEEQANVLGTQSGREAWLQKQYGKGQQYTAGENLLDAAIMGGLRGDELSGLAKKYGQLYETVSGKQQAAQAKYKDQKLQEADAKKLKEAADEKTRAATAEAQNRARVKYEEQERKKEAWRRAQERWNYLGNLQNSNLNDADKKRLADQIYAQEAADADYQEYRNREGGWGNMSTMAYEAYLDEELKSAGLK